MVVDVVAHCFFKLVVIDVDYPKCSAVCIAAICALKNFGFVNLTHSCIVKLPPLVVTMVLYKVEIVPAICVAFMNTYGMKRVELSILFFNLIKAGIYFLFEFTNVI